MRNSFVSRLSHVAWLALALMWPVFGEAAQALEETLRSSLAEQRGNNTDAARTQVRIAQLSDQTAELLGDYRVTTQQLDRVRIYNSHLQKLVNDQEEEKASINRQLTDSGWPTLSQQQIDGILGDNARRLLKIDSM